MCYVHSWFSIVPTAWVPFVWLCFDLIHTPVCNVPATEKFLPSSLWLLRGAKANILGSHHKLLLMFQEKRSSSSCRLLGRWWCKHEDAKRISRVCLYHLSEDKGLREVTKRTTEWKPVNLHIEMEFYINTKHIWEALLQIYAFNS